MAQENQNLLKDAIARNSSAVLSLPSAGLLRHHKARFLAEAPDGFWVESVPEEKPLVEELIAAKKPAGISFKSGVNKVVLASPILRREPAYRVNADTTVEAILLAFPEVVRASQRRNNYRVRVWPETELSIRVWRVAEKAYLGDRPMAAQEVQAELRDISVGGIGVTFTGKAGEPPKVSAADRLRIELSYSGTPVLLEGRMREPGGPVQPGILRTGIQFKALQGDLEGRQRLALLTKIVGELQREEARRTRMGLISPAE
jgi:hypothetical protein